MDEGGPAEKRIGRVIHDKWKLERLLGVGGMAAVYVARHKIGRLDAIKILHPEYAHAAQIRQRFEQEAHVLNRFKHPGAVEVRDMDVTDDGAPFLVMELLEGEPLSRVLKTRKLTADDVLRIADETLDVLAAAHAQGILHRDIKPDNLFILPSGQVKVLDFGIARLRAANEGTPDLKTKTGTTLGTVAYMSPEQALGKTDIDARVDIYAVGATMFRILAGRHVHTSESQVELLMKIVTEPAPKLATVAPSIPAPVCAVIDRAVAFDRDARYPDAKSMQLDVRAVREGRPAALAAAPDISAAQRDAPTVTPMREGTRPIEAVAPPSQLVTRAVEAVPLPTRSFEAGVGYPPQAAVAPAVDASVASLAGEAKPKTLRVPLVWLVGGAALLMGAIVATILGIVFALNSGDESASQRQPAPAISASVPKKRALGPAPNHPVFWTTGTAEGR